MLRFQRPPPGEHTRSQVVCITRPTKRQLEEMACTRVQQVLAISMPNCRPSRSPPNPRILLTSRSTEPLYKHLATGWEKAFQRRLPHVLKACSTAFSKSLRGFHKELETRARARGGANPRLGMLEHQLKAYEAVFTDLANRMVESINEQQREANREFTPSVCQAMRQAYQLTTDERGKLQT